MQDDPQNGSLLDSLPDANRSAFLFPLPKTRMEFTGERFVSGLDGQIKHEHYHRYLFATRYCVGKDVLDVASGEGYGSALLGQIAGNVIGVDIDHASVDYANKTYISSNVSFKQGNAISLPIGAASVDVVVSFETIEHFGEHDQFLTEVSRVLRPGGLLIISSPNKIVYDRQNAEPNAFHVHELDRGEFLTLLKGRFEHVAVCEQRALNGSIIVQSGGSDATAFETFDADDGLLYTRQGGVSEVAYFVAIASNAPVPRPLSSLLHNAAHILGLHAALDHLNQEAITARTGRAVDADDHRREQERLLTASDILRAQLRAKTQQIQQADARVVQFQSLLAERAQVLDDMELRVDDLQARYHGSNERFADLTDHLAHQAGELRLARVHLGQVFTSRSWILSEPVRWAGSVRHRGIVAAIRSVARIAWWAVTLRLRAKTREQRRIDLMYNTDSFDANYYLHRYPDVASAGIDPALHYWRIGAAEERDPSAAFSTAVYRSRHPELPLHANPLLDAILTGRSADGRTHRPRALDPAPPSPEPEEMVVESPSAPVSATSDLSTLHYNEHERPEIAIVVDARSPTPEVAQTLRAISSGEQKLTGELFVLVAAGSDFAFAGARRVIVGDQPILSCVERVLELTRAPAAVFIDGTTTLNEEAIAAGLATLTSSTDVAVVCGVRSTASGTVADAGWRLDPDGTLHARGAGLPREHYAIQHLAPVDVFTPGLFVIETAAWREAGGLNVAFESPGSAASDLSMRLRSAGRSLLCQPLMTAHTSADVGAVTDTPTDVDRVVDLWGSSLEQAKRHPRPRVLIIDALTPTPDRDAGSNVLAWYVRIFQDLGYHVSFLPALEPLPRGSYVDDLRQQGVEFISMPDGMDYEAYVQNNAASFKIVMIYRIIIADIYIDIVRRASPLSCIIFNTVDLHFLREEREATLQQSAEAVDAALETKRIELAAMRKADCTILLSRAEHELIKRLVPDAYTQFIPLTQPAPGSETAFEARQDIIFVGGFNHKPNIDAVYFLLEQIWPLVHVRLPDVRLIIVGSSASEEIMALDDPSKGIEVRGFVPDLSGLLRTCRLTVAPLRYGAGMKGKVVNSLAHGVPCIATTIAVEGTGLIDGRDILVADDPSAYADAVESAYTNHQLWNELSVNGAAFAEENFSVRKVTVTIKQMLSNLGLLNEK